jgi:hypothetical protein
MRQHLKLKDIDILDVGNTMQISGIIYSEYGTDFLCFLPDFVNEEHNNVFLDMDLEDWRKFFRQTDLLETVIFTKDDNGKLIKTVVRKSERQIDQFVTWKVFQRDSYTCRYCGKTGIPLTIDHLILWEIGGLTISENLLTSCRRCNKARGNMEYETWLNSDIYKTLSKDIDADVRWANEYLVSTLPLLPIRKNIKSR